jgi:predicted esterase
MMVTLSPDGPHQGHPLLLAEAGEALEDALGAVVMIHGRGDSAAGILSLAPELAAPGIAFVAPQAEGSTWYPNRFTAPLERNEPYLGSALQAVGDAVAAVGLPPERVMMLGFSQGACLGLEFAARNARRYGAVAGLSGGLIGPTVDESQYSGSLDGTPVLLGCSDVDPHIPLERVRESADLLERLGGVVDLRIYPRLGHTVNMDEIEAARTLVTSLGQDPASPGGVTPREAA